MRNRWMVVVLLLLFAVPAAAQDGPTLRWAQYNNIVEIAGDGSMVVAEQQRIVVEQGPLRRMTRTFDLAGAQVRDVAVLEDGSPYRRDTGEVPGTWSATSDGASVNIRVFFRDPNAAEHNLELRYTLQDALVAPDNTNALLDWQFFWGNNAPPIDAGSVEVRFPATVTDAFQFDVVNAPVEQSISGNTVRWNLIEQIQGQQVRVQALFPQTVLNAGVALRAPGEGVVTPPEQANGGDGNTVPPQTAPDDSVIGVPGTPSAVGSIGSVLFCGFVLIMLFIVFAVLRASARGRGRPGPVYGPTMPPMIDPNPWGGMRRGRRGRRRYGGGGVFLPPIFIPPPSAPQPWGNPRDNTPSDSGGGGGGWGWGDSGGGGSSWGNSGGGGSSWGSSGGGGSSWGGGGGGSSGGGGGSSGGGGGGGGSFG